MSQHTYSVYLVQHPGSQGGERQVTSPVTGSALDFYESGVWLTREEGKNFFPYDQIRTIREHPEGGGPEAKGERSEVEDDGDESGEETGESQAESEDGGGDQQDSNRDEGAEEDLLE